MTDELFMSAPHSRRIAKEDPIFRLNREAQQAAKEYGAENVINATVGSLLDDNGKLIVLPTVMKVLRSLDDEDFSAYAPIGGTPEFLDAVKKAAFGNFMPYGYTEAVATPGGTGAIRHTIWNYTRYKDTVLTADWFWGPYRNISDEHGRRLDTFSLFDGQYNFNIASFDYKVHQIVKEQQSIVILFNFPANNPTGYNMSSDEWDDVIRVLKKNADGGSRIVLFVDIAYIDYSGKPEETREFLAKFSSLPSNILIVLGFSMSKSYTLYGMRSGAMIGISSSESIAREFKAVNEYSNRGTWSNGTRPAMTVLARIFEDDNLYRSVQREREALRIMLNSRAAAFNEQCEKAGLITCPYNSGFFISIPCANPGRICEELIRQNIYAVPMSKGIRFALCSVSEERCSHVPLKMAETMKNI